MKGMIEFASLLLLFAGAFADSNMSRPDVLGLKYDLMGCRVDAVIALVEYGMDNTNVSGGDEIIAGLEGDMESLGEYADKGDRQGFNEFMQDELREDLKNAVIYLKDVKRELISGNQGGGNHSGGPNEGMNEWVELHQSVMQERAECIQSTALDFARGQENEFEERLRNMNETMENLRNKGVDVSEMEDIMDEAYENLEELSDAIDTGNVSTIHETVKQLREKHLHIWARFHIAKVDAILDAIEQQADEAGYSSEVSEIRALMDGIEPLVQPGNPYDPGEFEEVKTALREAHQKLRDLIRMLNSGGSP